MKRIILSLLSLSLLVNTTLGQLIVHYDFNGTVDDQSGNGNDGILFGNPPFVDADTGQGLYFDNPIQSQPATQFVRVPFTQDIQDLSNSSFTVGVKYRSDDVFQFNGRLVGQCPQLTMNYNRGAHPVASVFIQDAFVEVPEDPDSITTDGQWHWQFAVVDRDSLTLSMYVDEKLIGSDSFDSLPPTVLDNFWVGANGGNCSSTTQRFAARLTTVDEFMVWNVALDEEEIQGVINESSDSSCIGGPLRFLPASFFGAGDLPLSVVSSDLNGDGNLDLAIANNDSNDVSVLLNSGFGTFAVGNSYSAGNSPISVDSGDLDGDGDIDLVVGNGSSSQTVSVLLNNGDGSFLPEVAYNVNGSGPQATICDLDNDNDLDLAVANFSTDDISILLNNGNGVFTLQGVFPLVNGPRLPMPGDFDNDGDIDLAIANVQSNLISVMINNGDGTFMPQVAYVVGDGSSDVRVASLAVGDIDGDGNVDLVAGVTNSNRISVFRNTGDGTFEDQVAYGELREGDRVVLGDWDGDNDLDIAALDSSNGSVWFFMNDGGGAFDSNFNVFTFGESSSGPVVGDINGDGALDLIVANPLSDSVAVFQNSSLGCAFEAEVTYESDPMGAVKLGDLDGDGQIDLVTLGIDSVLVWTNDGNGGLLAPSSYDTSGASGRLALGDLDGDSDLDLAVSNTFSDNVTILLNNGDGTLSQPTTYKTGSRPGTIAIGDLDGDGDLDVAVENGLSDDVSLLFNNGDGTFDDSQQVFLNAGGSPRSLVIGDLDNDDDLDVAIAIDSDQISIRLNNGNGTFAAASFYDVKQSDDDVSPTCVSIGDFDGDSDLDLALSLGGGIFGGAFDVAVLHNNGDGTFATPDFYEIGSGASDLTVADIDGDSDLDLAISNRFEISVLVNLGDGTFQEYIDLDSTLFPRTLAFGDLDSDGDLDLVVETETNQAVDEFTVYFNDCEASSSRLITIASSTFDSNMDGWTGAGQWQADGGNPGGFADYIFSGPAPTDIIAPAEFLGDWSGLDGTGSFHFDHKLFDVGAGITEFFPYSVVIQGPGGTARWTGPTPTSATGWLRFNIPIDECFWEVEVGQWDDILPAITTVGVRIELVGTILENDRNGLDNIQLRRTLFLGDVNLDGVVNLLDVAPFVELLSSGDFQAEADINQDGVVDLLDVQPFVDLLSGR